MNGTTQHDAGRVLHEKLRTTRVGLRWERILRTHEREIDTLVTIHPDVRRHVAEALHLLAEAGVARTALDDTVIAKATTVLDDLQRLGGFELRAAVVGLREELALARGRNLDDVLTG
jgi:hypothetical protein